MSNGLGAFAPGSVSLGLHPPEDVEAIEAVASLVQQAGRAEAVGFDGVTISEHHVGFPGYLPQPLLIAVRLLSVLDHIWVAPSPLLLSLRSPNLLAEEFAWANAAFPGRFSAAVAAGYWDGDFTAAGQDPTAGKRSFPARLAELVTALSAGGPLSADPAVRSWSSAAPPLLAAAASGGAARRAAEHGLGVLVPSGLTIAQLSKLADQYRDSGGVGPVVIVKQVWLGERPDEAVARLQTRYASAAAPGERVFRAEVTHGSADEIVDRVADARDAVGGDAAINLRVHLAGLETADVLAQLAAIAEEVVPRLRT